MALSAAAEQAVRDEAERRGVDPDEAVEHARALDSKGNEPEPEKADGGKPTFDRLLLGALPFMTVREFRAGWLGLSAPIKDDHLTCGEFQAKYSGGAAAAPSTTEPE